MNKRIIKTSALCAVLIMIIQQVCFGEVTLNYDYDNGKIIVSGHDANKKRVSVQVLNPDADLSGGDADKYDEYFAYAGYCDCDESGNYTADIKLDGMDADETIYKLRINGEEYEYDFPFTRKSKIDEILSAVNNAKDGRVLAENLKQYSRLMGCRVYVLFDNITENDKIRIAERLIAEENVNCAKFTDIVNKEVIPSALRNAGDESTFSSVFDNYGQLLPIDLENEFYSSLGDTGKSKVKNRMYAERARSVDAKAVAVLLDEAVVLEGIDNVSQKSQVGDIIDYFSYLFTRYTSYQALGDDKAALWENAIDADKPSFAEFENLFNTWLDGSGKKPDSNKKPGGGGGSGGGSGGSWSGGGNNSNGSGGMYVVPTVKQAFADMESVPWAQQSVEALYERGVVSGTGDGMFSPQNSVKREEFVQMISLAMGLDEASEDKGFTDAKDGAWYTLSINAAANAGVINGISESVFGVGMNISRQDMAVIMERCLKYAGYSLGDNEDAEFEDSDNISDYAKSAVSALSKHGVIKGFEDNTFRPFDSVSRAQAAVVVHRFILLTEGKG